jgi:MFS family permease
VPVSADPPRSATRSPLPRVVVALGVVSLLTDVHSEAILAVLPVFVAETLAAGALGVGLMEGLAELTAAAFRIWAGGASDRTARRKPWVVFGYGFSTLSKLAMAFVRGGAAAIGVRVLERVGKGLRSAPRDALMADAVPPERRGAAFGFHLAMDTTGAVLGAGLAFLLVSASVPPRDLMLWAAIPGVLAVAVLALFVRETARTESGRSPTIGQETSHPPPADGESKFPIVGDLPDSVRRVSLGRFLVVEGVFGVAYASYAFFLLRARALGASLAMLPLLYLAYNAVYAAVPWPLGALADRFGRARVLALGYVAFALACLAAGLARSGTDAWIWTSFGFFGVASAAVASTPRAIVAEALGPHRRGKALGLHYGVTGVAAVLSGVAFGALWEPVGHATLFLGAAGLSVAAAAALPLAFPRR